MKPSILLSLAILGAFSLSARAVIVVNDNWLDSDRTDPGSPIYSENGVDVDGDGNIESAWYNAGTGATLAATPGHMVMTPGTSSASWTTYFTPEASPITLANAGDRLTVIWVFTPSGVNGANTSQNFRLAVVNSAATNRVSSEAAPTSGPYTGYAMFMNMAQVLGNSNPFRLMERTNPDPGTGAFLGTSGDWTPLANGATSGNTGYASGTLYTYSMTLTRNAANGLDIESLMIGGNLNNTGTNSIMFTDSTPNGSSFTFDTFGIRPSDAATTATSFDTSLFRVEYTPVPEPSTFILMGLGVGAFFALRRRATC